MRRSIKPRYYFAMIIIIAIIITAIGPGAVNANPSDGEAGGILTSSSLIADKQEPGTMPGMISEDFNDIKNNPAPATIHALKTMGMFSDLPDGSIRPDIPLSQLAAILKGILSQNLANGSRAVNDKELVSLDIFTVNDFHGALLESDKNPGAAKLGQLLKAKKAKNPDGTLILSAGDMSQGSVDSNLTFGKTVIDVMDEIGFDAMAVGNHEFDWGRANLTDQASWADFPVLTANVTDKNNGCLEGIQPWVIVERKGVNIGIIGVTTTEIVDKVSQKVISTCQVASPADVINKLVPELEQQGAQIIIVLGHLGGYPSNKNGEISGEVTEMANAIKGVDILVTGHTHQNMAGYLNGIATVQAGYNGRAVGHITLTYSPRSQKVFSAVPSVIDLPTSVLKGDAGVKAIIDQGQKEIGPIKNEIIGNTIGDLPHQRDQVSVLGQWVTDIMRQKTNADIAFQNGGGLRTSIPAGEVTVGKLWEVIPFDNTLFLLDMKGSRIMKVLEYGINNPKLQCIQYSGIKVKYDSSLPAGSQIVEVTLPDGSPLDPGRTYRVVTNDFLAEGGDGYSMFKEGKNIVNTSHLTRQVLIEEIKRLKVIDFTGDDRLQDNRTGKEEKNRVISHFDYVTPARAA